MIYIRFALIIGSAVIALIFALPVIKLKIVNTGTYMGFIFALITAYYGIFFKQVNSFFKLLSSFVFGRIIIFFLATIFLFLLSFAAVVTVNILLKMNNHPKEETTILVLGCRVRKDGASTMLKTRLNATYKYLTENQNVKCILSGGKGVDEPCAESEYMYNYLIEKGIDKNRLYVEDLSTTTEENLLFSKRIIEQNNLIDKITIITNGFHQYRAYRFAKELDLETYSYSAKTPLIVLPTYYIREICGVAHMIFIRKR